MPRGGKRLRKSDGLAAGTKRTPAVEEEVLSILSIGIDKITACDAAGIDYETWRLWCRKDPSLAAREARAQAKAIVSDVAHIHKAGRSNETSGDWRALAWKMEKLYPLRFGSRAVLDVNTTVEHDYSKLNLDEKKQLRSLMLKSAIEGDDEDE